MSALVIESSTAFNEDSMSSDLKGFLYTEKAIIIKCKVPPTVTLAKTPYGLGVFAAKDCKKGEVIYTGTYSLIPDDGVSKPIRLITDIGEFDMTTEMHTVGIGFGKEKFRQAYTFDSFMNHSCDPTTYSADEQETEEGGTYKTVALRDMKAGEEITCDYDLFEMDSRKKGIDHCECGASNCRGFSHGFGFLPEETQTALLPILYDEVLEAFLDANPRVMYRKVSIPEGIALQKYGSPSEYYLVASKQFSPGEVLFSYESEYFDSSLFDKLLIDVKLGDSGGSVIVNGVEMWSQPNRLVKKLEFLEHTVNRGGTMREFFQFDTFCEHSCDPNAAFNYLDGSKTRCQTVALREINIGDVITNDYYTFDEALDGTEFECHCGADACRGIIKG